MKTLIVIPARQASTRFPGKPMALVSGKSLLSRVWQIAKTVRGIDQVVIATDHEKIQKHAESFGAEVVFTRADCENGTERAYDAARKIIPRPDIVLNLQGDAVLTPPWIIQSLVNEMLRSPEIQMATPATRLNWEKYDEFVKSKSEGRVSGTLVVFDKNYNALYFSKGLIPFLRDRELKEPPIYRHIGLYAYRYSALEKYVSLSMTPLEQAEKLEQLRALENGIPIKIVPVDYQGRTHWSVDNPEDIQKVEEIILREGELVR